MAAAGIYARQRASSAPSAAQLKRNVQMGGSAKLSRSEAALSGSVNGSGLAMLAVILGGLWAVDRYAVNLPFFKATGAKS